MAEFTNEGVTIHFEDVGTGYPILLLAPGGLQSTIARWSTARIDPLTEFAGEFRLIAMDQRNAGESTGPFPIEDPWGAYVADQLRLIDYLGIDHFQVFGCCIGCSFALKIAELVPTRLDAAVLEQPIGSTAANHDHWLEGLRSFVGGLVEERDDLTAEQGAAFGTAMWDEKDFVFAVTKDAVRSCEVPLLVMPGLNMPHPHETALEIVSLAPNVECIDPWQDLGAVRDGAVARTRAFMHRYARS